MAGPQGGHVGSAAAFHSGGFLAKACLSLVRPATLGGFWPLIGPGADPGSAKTPGWPACQPPGRWTRIRACVPGGWPFRDPVNPAGSSPLRAYTAPVCPPFQTTGTSPLGADGAKLGTGVVDRKRAQRFPRAVRAKGHGFRAALRKKSIPYPRLRAWGKAKLTSGGTSVESKTCHAVLGE